MVAFLHPQRGITIVAEERFLHGAQRECRDQHHTKPGDPDRRRERLPHTEEDCDFRGKTAESGNAHRGSSGDNKRERQERHRAIESHAREVVQIARMRPIIDGAGKCEEQRTDHAVRKHLQDRSGNTEEVARRQTEENETHVAHTRVTDNELEIALAQRDRGRVDDPDDRENRDPFAPNLKT